MSRIPVLMYHHIAPDREVTPGQFEEHLGYLKEAGYRTPRLVEFYEILTKTVKTKDKLLLITFDDGYADNWICAAPLLKKYGFNAVIFPVSERLGEGPVRPTTADGAKPPLTLERERAPEGFLTWPELKAMTDSGVFEAGSHTHTHRNFKKRASYADLGWELETSGRLIAERTGKKPFSIGWPWGHHEKSWEGALKKAGYKMAFTTVTGINRPGTDPFYIKRIKVMRGGLGWLKNRLFLHRLPVVSELYGKLYGLDGRIKKRLRG